ncbi:MAG: 1-deoxy-D-xylulose-5-phosphate reductoisomerase [Rhodospirillaceae bacterium]|nr:1-deoxy-D-xylulose-5-phosphate reductoisomerase [Rhodospirillaceae bacterium]MDD9925496.1 1-deoxy-D-xylulose-5-phosphate reductoisomerase [Rhodospirillaceae bacterium]
MAVMVQDATSAPRSVTILGSTGSVGCSTIDLIERNPDAYVVEALTARRNADLLVEQAKKLRPRYVAIGDEEHYHAVKAGLSGSGIEVAAGKEAIVAAARHPADFVMAAIVGAAGLAPTLAAVNRGAMVGLANKECLVCAGSLMVEEINRNSAVLLPVDSEHNAIFQVFDFERRDAVDKLILTASGGPFRSFDQEAMRSVTPAQAVAHPNWDMGAKISVDSATMMNKGLEIIEAHHLFDIPEERIEVLVHPQSVIHSMVAYVDGSVLAQLGTPDMRTPIAYALAWPARMQSPQERLDLAAMAKLTFEPPDPDRFPALRLAREVLKNGGSAPTVLNAANEVAVEGFLAGQIGFLDIAAIVEDVLMQFSHGAMHSLDDVRAFDEEARRIANHHLAARSSN